MLLIAAAALALLSGLASYALAHGLLTDTGPFRLYALAREALTRMAYRSGVGWVQEGVQCPKCLAFWLGLVASLPALMLDGWLYPLVVLASHGVAIAIHYQVLASVATMAQAGRE